MARIAGIDLPREKRVEIGLTYIYGIGRPMSNKILQATGINRLLSRGKTSQGIARPRTEHEAERAHAQGPETYRRPRQKGD